MSDVWVKQMTMSDGTTRRPLVERWEYFRSEVEYWNKQWNEVNYYWALKSICRGMIGFSKEYSEPAKKKAAEIVCGVYSDSDMCMRAHQLADELGIPA